MASCVLTVGLGPVEDRATYQFWCMHGEGEKFVSGRELRRRAIWAGFIGNRKDREHMILWSRQLPADLAGKFPTFTRDLDSDMLAGYMHTDGFGNWCYDQAELDGMCDSRTLYVYRVSDPMPPP